MKNYEITINKFEKLIIDLNNTNDSTQQKILRKNLAKILDDIDHAIQTCHLNSEDYISIVVNCTSLKPISDDIAARICKIFKSLYDEQGFRSLSEYSEDIILFISDYIFKFTNNESLICMGLQILKLTLAKHQSCSMKVCNSLCSKPGFLIKLIEQDISKSCTLEGLRVLQLLTYRSFEDSNKPHETNEIMHAQVISNCQKSSLSYLKDSSLQKTTSEIDSYINVACLSVIYNVLSYYPSQALTGLIISVCEPYIFYKLKCIPTAQFSEFEITDMSDFLEDDDKSGIRQENSVHSKQKRKLRRKKNQLLIPIPVYVKVSSVRSFNISRSTLRSQDISLKPQWMTTEQCETNIQKPSIPSVVRNLECSTTVKEVSVRFSQNNCFFENCNASTTKKSNSSQEASVRQCALYVMDALLQATGNQNKFSFWPHLMCREPSVMTCILRDPDVTARMAALQVVNTFLLDSNSVLSLSVDCDDARSFTTLGKQLGTSIRVLHRSLALALLSEKMAKVLIRILKAIKLLFENVNYYKLKPGLLSKIMVHVKYFLKYKDTIVRAKAFSTMVSFLKIKPKTPEITSILTRYQIPMAKAFKNTTVLQPLPDNEEVYFGQESEELLLQNTSSDDCFSSDSSNNYETDTTTVLWILQRCVDSLLYEDDLSAGMSLQVKIQSIKVLNSLISEHFILIQSSLPVVQNVITSYCNPSPSVRQLPEESLVEQGYLLLGSVLNTANCHQESTDCVLSKGDLHLSKEEALQLWLWAFQGPLAHILTYPEVHLHKIEDDDRSPNLEDNQMPCSKTIFLAGVTILSNTKDYVLCEIGEQYLLSILRAVMFLVTHTETDFKLCGIRIVGLIVEYPTVQESLFGIEIVRVAISCACQIFLSEDNSVKKNRLLSAWVLANISASLQQCRITWETSKSEPFLTKSVMVKFFQAAIMGCNDKDTIQPPAIRSLGNLVSYLPADLVSDSATRTYIDDVVNLLLKKSVSAHMKSRWNACHALGTILKQSNISFESTKWMGYLISSLSGLVENFKNFKVRILACAALCNISSRIYFGNEYLTVWKAFLNAITNLGNICGRQEVHHRDDLIWQLSYGICHLITLLEFDDLEQLEEMVDSNQEIIEKTMVQGDRLMPPEKASCFLKALEHIRKLLNSDVIGTNQEIILKTILSIIKI